MSEFVNYNQRGISLPPGCKDLIDLLERDRRLAEAAQPNLNARAQLVKGGETVGAFADMEAFAVMAFSSGASVTNLQIRSDEPQATVIYHHQAAWRQIAITLELNAGREATIRGLFEQRGLKAPQSVELPKFLFPNSPSRVGYDLTAACPDASRFREITTDIFRSVCGLNEKSILRFRYAVVDFVV